MCNINAYSEAIRVFREKDPREMAFNAGADYDPGVQKLSLSYYNIPVEVDFPSGEIRTVGNQELVKNDKVLILQYLFTTTGASPRNDWISFIQLPGGPHHHTPFVLDAIEPLAREFGDNLDGFAQKVRALGGSEIKMGDLGFVIHVFPKLPMAVCLRRGDDEFPASANILFDGAAPFHLTTAALWVMGVELSRKLRNVQGQQFA